MKMYMVGGCVRDEILGVSSKDIDFSCVLDPSDLPDRSLSVTNLTPFEVMRDNLVAMGFKIFLETPEYFTVRAQFPIRSFRDLDAMDDQGNVIPAKRLTADFVLARKESSYTDGRRPDRVEIGTLEDDLARRDFRMNAIAKDAEGNLIDPFNGVQDINERVIRAVGDAYDRLSEDALRAVRALRFSVTKQFRIDHELRFAMESASVLDSLVNNISDERIKDELSKMFRYDTLASVRELAAYPLLTEAMFAGKVSLDATMKTKGRGK